MNTRALRRIAFALIGLLVYAQASVALAGCLMDRGDMAQAAALHQCCDTQEDASAPQLGNACVAHCTSDLQLFELPAALVRSPADVAVLWVPTQGASAPDMRALAGLRASAVPPRILFQSFQV